MKKSFLLSSILMLFVSTIALAQPSNDSLIHAIDVSTIIDSCSLDAAYTTTDATPDSLLASCGSPSGYNVWFKFQATSTSINVAIDRGGTKGTIRKINVALFNSTGINQLTCNSFIGTYDDVELDYLSLTVGDWYYISVDNNGASNVGTFTMCLSTTPSYDFYEGAYDISSLIDTCSADAAYSTAGATSDLNTGSCNDAGDYNRWFKFQATTTSMTITVDRGGAQGTIRKINVALWEDDGTTEVGCKKYISTYDDVELAGLGLTVGDWYYISVDNNGSTNRGSFTLCLDTELSYDFYEGAIDVSAYMDTCTPDAAYTTIGATADLSDGSCGDAGDYNRWFKFQATAATVNVTVDRGGSKGSIRKINLALWDSTGINEVACKRYVSTYDDVEVAALTLTVGDWYYISVDNNGSSNQGTFTLCLSTDLSYDYYEGAKDITSSIGSCSVDGEYTTIGATSDKNTGSCNDAGDYNRWFKFQANSDELTILIDRGGSKGTLRKANATLWEADGTTQVACAKYVGTYDDIKMEDVALTIGNWYYVSVDNKDASNRGSFTLCLYNYDYFEGAKDVTAFIGGCSPDAEYTTVGATMDLYQGSCNNGSGYNRWFKFQANSSKIDVLIDRGSTKGTIQRVNAAIWEADGVSEISCNRYLSDSDDVHVESSFLIPGDWYYISVDNNYSGYKGTFTLCLDTILTYDFYEGAVDITAILDSCSADAEYSTKGATADLSDGSCGNAGDYNRWFKFQANATTLNLTVGRGGSQGDIKRVNATVWEADGMSEIACNRYVNDADTVQVAALDLIIGDWYYISVDNNYSGYRGSFTLCLDSNLSYDYYEGAIDVSSYIGSCSPDAAYNTLGATADMNDGSCGNAGDYNRWFKFQATSTNLNLKVDRGGSKGTIKRVNAAIWEADGNSEVACNRYVNDVDTVEVAALGLTIGDWYYISIDNNYSGYRGTFTLCLDTTVSYDYFEGAKDISAYVGGCTPDAAYTTVGATMDMGSGSCSNASGYNRWFKFQATSPELNLTVGRGGSQGTIKRVNAVIWEADGNSEVACNRYVNDNDTVEVLASGLILGDWYYISIDNNYSGYRGTFTLCLDTTPSYDFYGGAIELTNLNTYCSPDAAYTTIGATADMADGTCGNAGDYNRWFKFTAVDSVVTYTIKRGGSFGTIKRINTTLWEADGSTEVACAKYALDNDDITITDSNLTPGNVYYISVDNNYSGYRGTFTICINNVGAPFYSRASGNWNTASTWSNDSINGPAALTAPGIGSIVYIDGYAVTITADDTCAEINMDVSNGASSLTVDGSALTVMGAFNHFNTGFNTTGSVALTNGGDLFVNDDFFIARNGGANAVTFTADSGSVLTVNQEFQMLTTGGTGDLNTITFNGTSSLMVNGDMQMIQSSGVESDLIFNDSATGEIFGEFVFVAANDNTVGIKLNDDASLTFHTGITKGTPGYGSINSLDNSSISFVDYQTSHTIPSNSSAGTTDEVVYNNLTVSSNTPAVVNITEDLFIESTLTIPALNLTVNIHPGISVSLGGSIYNDGVINMMDSASFIQRHSGVNTNGGSGSYNVKQTGTTDVLIYNVWSSPIQNADLISSFVGVNPCDLYAFEADSQAFKYDYANGFSTSCLGNPVTFGSNDVLQGGDGTADVGRGYFIPNGSSASKVFNGQVNNGDLSMTIATSNVVNDPIWNGNDWNLIGNPYPSGLSAEEFWNENAVNNSRITDAVYFWDVNEYASWNLSGGVANGSGEVPNGSIGVAQGFFVVADSATALPSTNVVFNNSMRNDTNTQFFKTEIENHNVWVNIATPSGSKNNILVGYTDQATNGYDKLYDAHKLSGNANIRFSSMLNNEEFVIQSFAPLAFGGQKVIPLTVYTAETGTHTFSEMRRENIDAGMTIYLRDTETGMAYDLTKGDYTVELTANSTYTTRFELVFENNDAATSVVEVKESNFSLLTTANGYTLQNNEGINGDIQVMDVTGKVVWTKTNVTSNQVHINLEGVSAGIYIVNVLNSNARVYSNKIVK